MVAFWIVLCIAATIVIIVLGQKLSKEKQKTKLLTEAKVKESELEEKRLAELREKINKLTTQKQWIEVKTEEAKTNFERNEEMRQKTYAENEQKRNEVIAALDKQIAAQNSVLEQAKSEYNNVIAAKEKTAAENNSVQVEISVLRQEIKSLQQQHSAATKRNGDELYEGLTLSYSKEDERLVNLLDRVKADYPDLTVEIAEIEWRKVWQPLFKNMTSEMGRVSGIYRIWTIDDKGFCRNYIGKGVDIRDRWSDHIKKMIGSKAAGNELLYKFVTPEIAHFEIVEEVPEEKLTEREHYWIEFYNGTTDGYNTNK